MGWFSNAARNLRPDRILKDPKKATRMALDPAGEVVRAGRSNYNSLPNNMRSAFDPGGFFDGRTFTPMADRYATSTRNRRAK